MSRENDSFWEGRSVLVTGAAGLLGGWTLDALSRLGASATGLDIAWTEDSRRRTARTVGIIDGDVRELKTLCEALGDLNIQAVIHLAAQTLVGRGVEDPVATFEHNIAGSWTVLEAARQFPKIEAVIIASSDKAYGDAGGEPYREDSPLRAGHPYDVSKACADLIAQTYGGTYGVPVGISRCGNLFGGGDLNWSRIVPGTIRSVIEGEPPLIRSDGSYVRDYLYIEDAVQAMLALTRALTEQPELKGEAFNFAAGERLSVLEMVSKILDLMGSDLAPNIQNSARHEIPEQRLDSSKARRLLGWAPHHALEEGLVRTIAWYREHLGK